MFESHLRAIFKTLLLWSLVAVPASITACLINQKPGVTGGLQPEARAESPSRTLCLPVVSGPHPYLNDRLDPSLLSTSGVFPLIEKEILNAFKNQPRVEGVSFHAVRQGLAQSSLEKQFRDVALARLTERPASGARLSLFRQDCEQCNPLLEHYLGHFSGRADWLNTLSAISARFKAADAALLVLVTGLDQQWRGSSPTYQLSGAILLVDMNNSHLLWGREFRRKRQIDGVTEAPWALVVKEAFGGESFWEGYPSRLSASAVKPL